MTQPSTPEIAAPADAAEPLASDLGQPADGSAPTPSTPEPTALEPSASRGGAPANNANALRHGLHADPARQFVRLTLGALPRSLRRAESDAYEYRQRLEEAVSDAHGEISLTMAHAIDSAVRHFRHGQAALAWLRKHGEEMDHATRLAYSKSIAESADKRDKCIDRLKLDARARSVWDYANAATAN